MTLEQFLAKHRHELGGLILDAATHGLHGKELSIWLRGAYARIDAKLRAAYTDLKEPVEANGKVRQG